MISFRYKIEGFRKDVKKLHSPHNNLIMEETLKTPVFWERVSFVRFLCLEHFKVKNSDQHMNNKTCYKHKWQNKKIWNKQKTSVTQSWGIFLAGSVASIQSKDIMLWRLPPRCFSPYQHNWSPSRLCCIATNSNK